MKKGKRAYVQTVRRKRQEETRLRIVEALVALHEEVGPRNTTVAAVAERAGVQRLTVYRHFEDEAAMLKACSSHWLMNHPPPDAKSWEAFDGPEERVLEALRRFSDYYRDTEPMLTKVYRDASDVKDLIPIMQGFDDYINAVGDGLAADLSGGKSSQELKSVARHLVRFQTWQSLARESLSSERIAQIGLKWLKSLVA